MNDHIRHTIINPIDGHRATKMRTRPKIEEDRADRRPRRYPPRQLQRRRRRHRRRRAAREIHFDEKVQPRVRTIRITIRIIIISSNNNNNLVVVVHENTYRTNGNSHDNGSRIVDQDPDRDDGKTDRFQSVERVRVDHAFHCVRIR
jgi:hypothetical protein